jgi:Rrf2 family protein
MISSRVAVAVHILAYLAWRRGQPCTSERIAASVNTNPVVVRRITGCLRQAGLVQALPGARGGTMLLRDPREISLLAVYRAVEGGEHLFAIHTHPSPHCGIGANIRGVLQGVFSRAHHAMQAALDEVTIAEICGRLNAGPARLEQRADA